VRTDAISTKDRRESQKGHTKLVVGRGSMHEVAALQPAAPASKNQHTCCLPGWVGAAAGVPQTAADLLHRQIPAAAGQQATPRARPNTLSF
jgi:hypothetical protein